MNNHDHTENAVDLTTAANTVLDYEMPVRIRIDNPMKCIKKEPRAQATITTFFHPTGRLIFWRFRLENLLSQIS